MWESSRIKLPSPQERLDLILLGLGRRQSIQSLCKQAGVSRELFYRWMRWVREAGLKALEAKAPGPKAYKKGNAELLLRKLAARNERLEKETLRLRKERNHLKVVIRVGQRIIRRQGWGPFPQVESKKNAMRRRKRETFTSKSGQQSKSLGPPSASLPGGGAFTEAPTGDGSQVCSRGQGPGS